MGYVESVLQPGETLLGRTTLHWFVYLPAIALLLLGLVLFGFSYRLEADDRQWAQIGVAIVALLALLYGLRAWFARMTHEYAVTDRRVIHKRGLFSRYTVEMNRDKVETVDVMQSIPGRIFGYGTVLVKGTGTTLEPFRKIADPISFRSHITAG